MRLVLAFTLHSALRMPPTPPPENPQKKEKQTAKEKTQKIIDVAAVLKRHPNSLSAGTIPG
ncbi:hypothetical protein [Pantoea sp. App145]|uniref:hypothetical protein n=1 Tax=Pantoea sp. App145 TaxID=3071567 RepID=UPI003A80D37A